MWLPALCKKSDIPYCIVKSKSRLGALVHQKTATAVALTSVRQEVRTRAKARTPTRTPMPLLAPACGLPAARHAELRPRSSLQDRHEFSQLVTAIRQQYNENAKSIERTWGGGIMGMKSQNRTAKMQKAIAKEAAKKAMM